MAADWAVRKAGSLAALTVACLAALLVDVWAERLVDSTVVMKVAD